MTDDQIAAIAERVNVEVEWCRANSNLDAHGGVRMTLREQSDLLAALAAATQEIERLKAERDEVAVSLQWAEGERAELSLRLEPAERQRDALREALHALVDVVMNAPECTHSDDPCEDCEVDREMQLGRAGTAAMAALAATEGQ